MAADAFKQKSKAFLVILAAGFLGALSSRADALTFQVASVSVTGTTGTVTITGDATAGVFAGLALATSASGPWADISGTQNMGARNNTWTFAADHSGTYYFRLGQGTSDGSPVFLSFSYLWNAATHSGVVGGGDGIPTTQPVTEPNGGSAVVYATRTGDVATVHVDQVSLPSGISNWVVMWNQPDSAGGSIFSPHQLPVNSTSMDFNQSGKPDGGGEGVWVYYTGLDGKTVTIWKGNVMFPGAPVPTTQQATNSIDPGGPTYNAGGPGQVDTTTATVVGPVAPGQPSNAPGTGGVQTKGTADDPVYTKGTDFWSETQPETPTSQPGKGTGSGTDASGVNFAARANGVKSEIQGAFGFDWASLAPTGDPDKVITIDAGTIGTVPLVFSIHAIPDTSTPMGQALETLRSLVRAMALCWVLFTAYQSCVAMLRRL